MKNPNVQRALEDMEYIRQTDPRRGHYKGEALAKKPCKQVPQFPGLTNLEEVYAVLRKCWKADTAYPNSQATWKSNDPSFGQCAITAALVCDLFGGTIHRIDTKGGGTHYFNKIDGQWVDLAYEQFTLYNQTYKEEPNTEIPRNKTSQGGDSRKRYVKLQQNMMLYLNKGLNKKKTEDKDNGKQRQ